MLAHRKVKAGSNNSCNKNDRHVALNSMVYPSQRQVTQGPQSQFCDTEQQAQKPQWSINDRDYFCKLSKVVWFSSFLECMICE